MSLSLPIFTLRHILFSSPVFASSLLFSSLLFSSLLFSSPFVSHLPASFWCALCGVCVLCVGQMTAGRCHTLLSPVTEESGEEGTNSEVSSPPACRSPSPGANTDAPLNQVLQTSRALQHHPTCPTSIIPPSNSPSNIIRNHHVNLCSNKCPS